MASHFCNSIKIRLFRIRELQVTAFDYVQVVFFGERVELFPGMLASVIV